MYLVADTESILGVPKEAERRIFSTLWAKCVRFVYKASSAEENDTKIIKFGWVILILCPFLEIQSFSNFAWFLWPMSEELCREKPSIYGVLWKPIGQCFFCCHGTMGYPQNTLWKAFPDNSSLIGCKNQAKLENDCISRNGRRIKITQPNLMILVSFSSAEDALSNDVKKWHF